MYVYIPVPFLASHSGFMKRILLLASLVVLAACASDEIERQDSYETDKDRNSRYAYGSVASERGGLSLMGGRDDAASKAGQSGIGVNAFLWRASLDTLSFLPIASADPFGGTIISEWYAPPSSPNERVKINVYIMGRELRADAVRVTVFRQQNTTAGWVDAQVATATAGSVEDAILTRARQLRVKQIAEGGR